MRPDILLILSSSDCATMEHLFWRGLNLHVDCVVVAMAHHLTDAAKVWITTKEDICINWVHLLQLLLRLLSESGIEESRTRWPNSNLVGTGRLFRCVALLVGSIATELHTFKQFHEQQNILVAAIDATIDVPLSLFNHLLVECFNALPLNSTVIVENPLLSIGHANNDCLRNIRPVDKARLA